jgi:hypothetical protein
MRIYLSYCIYISCVLNFTFVFVIEYSALINDQNLSSNSQYNAFNGDAVLIIS